MMLRSNTTSAARHDNVCNFLMADASVAPDRSDISACVLGELARRGVSGTMTMYGLPGRQVLTMRFSLSIPLCPLAPPAAAGNEKRPNIVFLLADDLRWNVLGCTGDNLAKTPHIDALAERGVLFRNHFVTTSICAVSRASILSGQYARRHKINDFGTDFTRDA